MKVKVVLFSLSALLAASTAQATVEIKQGLWEMRMLKMEADGKDMMEPIREQSRDAQARQAQLPPEQRRQIPDPLTSRICVSAAMVKWDSWQASLLAKEGGDCTQPKVSHNGGRITSETTCKLKDGARVNESESANETTVKMKMAMASGTSVKMVITAVMDGTSRHTAVHEYQMTFLDADCRGLTAFQ
jgi:hypothetical protein